MRQHDAVIGFGRVLWGVGGVDDGDASVAFLGQDGGDAGLGLGVEAGGRLVQEEQVRLLRDPLREQHTLALAAGEGAEPPVGEAGDAESVHALVHDRPVLAGESPPRPPMRPTAHGHGLPDGDRERVRDFAALHHECCATRVRPPERPGRQRVRSGEHAQQRRLP